VSLAAGLFLWGLGFEKIFKPNISIFERNIGRLKIEVGDL